jgi:hypothetical protein
MVAVIPLSPYVQVGGNSGLFNAYSTGVRQGTAYPDPSTRFRLRMALLAQSETIPMWGGVAVYMNVPGSQIANQSNPSYALGPICGRAGGLTGSTAVGRLVSMFGMALLTAFAAFDGGAMAGVVTYGTPSSSPLRSISASIIARPGT